MYLSADQECTGMPNSQGPEATALLAADIASANATFDIAVQGANRNWLGLLSRSWKSYEPLGRDTCFQLREGQPLITPLSIITGTIVAPGPNAPGAAPPDDTAAIMQHFGNTPDFKTFTGKLPKQGSSMSLVMGGQNRALPVGPGTYPAATPDARFGSMCGNDGSALASILGSGSGAGIGLTVLGLVALAGLAYWADSADRKRGRV